MISQPANIGRDQQLPATNDRSRRSANLDRVAFRHRARQISVVSRHPPGKLHRRDLHAGGGRDRRPGRKQPSRTRQQALGRNHFVETCQPDQNGHGIGQLDGQ